MSRETKSCLNIDAFPNSKVLDFDRFSKEIDSRLDKYLKGWQLHETYFGDTVNIPGHTNSQFEPIRYFEVVKKEDEAFSEYGERDNEICLTLLAHWPGFDHECEVNLFIRGKDVLNKNSNKVSAEIIRAGGAPMTVKWNGEEVTDFQVREWIFVRTVDKVWIDDMRIINQ